MEVLTPAAMPGATARQGFSLLELLLVLIILSLLLGLTAPLLTHALDGARLKRAQREIISALRFSRTRAINTQQVVIFSLHTDTGVMRTGEEERHVSFPGDATLSIQVPPAEQLSAHEHAVRLYPDGSATDMTLSFQRGEQVFGIEVDALTGRVSRVVP
ncbi:MAG: prepilin-type N-terminal cleavage/methylation domain-containing protein [Gammaproteobacteria bacterium]|nr:prepilin-type N-terminal cleavage/methylation domain-containing protein [Gammaproteobacteria bacterium]